MNGRLWRTVLAVEDRFDMSHYGEDSAASCTALSGTAELAEDASDEAFAGLVRRQSPFVFRVAFSVLRNVQDAEDVVQETFLKVYKSREWLALRDERAFLAKAAWRLAVGRAGNSKPVKPAEEPVDSAPSAELNLIKAGGEAALHRLMDALPLELRLPLALCAIDEMKSPEIAVVMGIPEGTVRTRLARARRILKEKLNQLEVRRG